MPPHELVMKFWEGSCSIKVEIFLRYEMPIRVFTGFLPQAQAREAAAQLFPQEMLLV